MLSWCYHSKVWEVHISVTRDAGRDLKHLLGLGTRQAGRGRAERRQELAKRGCKIDSDGNGNGYGG